MSDNEKNVSKGKVKWFDADKGFGFIEQENGEDLFVHINEIQVPTLYEGDTVEFVVGEGRKGPCAMDVNVL